MKPQQVITSSDVLDPPDATFEFETHSEGPTGSLPFTSDILINESSGFHFGMSQSAGMGWDPAELLRKHFLVLSTSGGLREHNGKPIALGLHTGHFELMDQVEEVAKELKRNKTIPFSLYCSDPCDGRSQGTTGMMDSLPYRNDAAVVFRRQARSLPTAKGILGIASCDKGLPAMMMALAGIHNLPVVVVPGGSTLAVREGEDTGMIQSIAARFSQGEVTLDYAQEVGCKACASPGGGCHFLGTAGTSQVISESLGLSIPHSALAPSGTPAWRDVARRSARALILLESIGLTSNQILTKSAFTNAMHVHAACGGSTNLLIHLPAISHAANVNRMTVDDWSRINKETPRIVDVLPNGPIGYPTSELYSAGGVPEVMLHLRNLGVLDTDIVTATGQSLGENLDWWEGSERRYEVRKRLLEKNGVDPSDVIMPPSKAKKRGLTSTVTFPKGNLAPEGSVIKSTAIDSSVVDDDGIYRITGPARVFTTETDAIKAIKSSDETARIKAGEIMVLKCGGPLGTGMEEVFQITGALKYLSYGKQVALITDARFSGVSTGACIGHIGPEALAGGPIGKLKDGDIIRIIIDRIKLEGSIDLIGENGNKYDVNWGIDELERRDLPSNLHPHPHIPNDSRLWAALQDASGGTWGGCVFDVDSILKTLAAGKKALSTEA